jgi:hypothetical protein
LKAGVWFRRGRLLMISPDSLAKACQLSGRNSTYRTVQNCGASSNTPTVSATFRSNDCHGPTLAFTRAYRTCLTSPASFGDKQLGPRGRTMRGLAGDLYRLLIAVAARQTRPAGGRCVALRLKSVICGGNSLASLSFQVSPLLCSQCPIRRRGLTGLLQCRGSRSNPLQRYPPDLAV